MTPTPESTNRRDWLVAGMAAASTAIALLANLAGIAQLLSEPLYIVALVVAFTLAGLGVPLLVKHKKAPKKAPFWIAVAALLCAWSIGLGTVVYLVAAPAGSINNPLIQPTAPAVNPTATSQNEPRVINTVTSQRLNPGRSVGQGIDLDTPGARPVNTEAIADDIDFVVHFYGTLEASQEGFYALPDGINTKDAYAECQKSIAERSPDKTITPMPGKQYCIHTSRNNVAWIVIGTSNVVSLDEDRHLTISAKVWEQ